MTEVQGWILIVWVTIGIGYMIGRDAAKRKG